MGILDSMFGGGGGGGGEQAPQQGPQSPGILSRMQAQYAPGAYEAVQRAQQQRAVYDAAMQTRGVSPQIAQAMAMSPQFFQAQQQSYLPQAPGIQTVQNNDGSTTLLQTRSPGGQGGKGGISVSGIPITEPPGTTSAPAGAAGAAPASAPATPATSGAEESDNTPAPVSGPKNTLSGMPGSTNSILAQIQANKAAGKDPTLGIPDNFKAMTRAVLDGRETLKNITSTRGAQTANAVNQIALTIDPTFDESVNEARNTSRKDYMSSSLGKTGGRITSFGTAIGHLNSQLDRAIALNNNDTEINGAPIGGTPGAHLSNWVKGTSGDRANKVNDFVTGRDTLAGETVRFLTGGEGSQTDRQQYAEKWGHNDTPRETAGTAQAYLKMLQDKAEELKGKQSADFGGKTELTKDMPIVRPEHEKAFAEIQRKIDFLKNKYKGGDTAAPPTAADTAPKGLPPGWKFVK